MVDFEWWWLGGRGFRSVGLGYGGGGSRGWLCGFCICFFFLSFLGYFNVLYIYFFNVLYKIIEHLM